MQYGGHTYGAPWFTDFGMVYYRKDLLAQYKLPLPTSWEQLQVEAKMLVAKHAVREGFVFQGSQYEGLVCNALEYVNGAGGRVYGPTAASTQMQAANGLATMRGMITSGASPQAVTAYKEAETANDFTNGLAAFARNWPYMWALAQGSGSKVVGKVGVLPMLHEPGKPGYSTLGGWWLGINKNTKNADQAWTFINYLISSQQEQYYAIHGGRRGHGLGQRQPGRPGGQPVPQVGGPAVADPAASDIAGLQRCLAAHAARLPQCPQR